MRSRKRLKICLVCSHGGHLIEMLRLKEAFTGHNFFLVTHKRSYSVPLNDISKVYLLPYFLPNFQHKHISRLLILINMIADTFSEFIIILKERPDVIVSTGSEITIPIFYMAKLFGKKIIYIESLHRVNELSATGKLTYPIIDLLLVQWPSLVEKYHKARYVGRVI